MLRNNKHANQLMSKILAIERQMGRVRNEKWGERIIDIDILFFNDEIIELEFLTVPHPRLHERRFALLPMSEIGPGFIHPVFQKSIETLLEECADDLAVNRTPTH